MLDSYSKYTKDLSDKEKMVAFMVAKVLKEHTTSDTRMKADMLIEKINPIIKDTNKYIMDRGEAKKYGVVVSKSINYVEKKQRSRISAMVQWLRNTGHSPIASDQKGYFWATKEADIIQLARTQAQRSRSSWSVAKSMHHFLPPHRKHLVEECGCGRKLSFECTEKCLLT